MYRPVFRWNSFKDTKNDTKFNITRLRKLYNTFQNTMNLFIS